MKLTAVRNVYHHGNRISWLGYGQRVPSKTNKLQGPEDIRAFREISLKHVRLGYPGSYIFCTYYVIKMHQINRLCFESTKNPNKNKKIFEIFEFFLTIISKLRWWAS